MAKRKKDKRKSSASRPHGGRKPAKARPRPKERSKSKRPVPKKTSRKDGGKKSGASTAPKKRTAPTAALRPAMPSTKPVLSRPVVPAEPSRLVPVPLPEGVRPQRLGEPNERSAHLEKLKQLFEAAPISRYLGMTLGYCENGVARVRLPFRKDFEEGHGVIHGGLIGLLGDTAGNFAVGSVSPGSTVKTVEFKLSLLAGVQGDLLAIGEVVRKGRTLATCRLEVVEGNDRVIAIGLATYALQAV
jgi:uncharacterized protein (TIGR00369 family)